MRMEIAIAVIVLVVAVVILGSSPLVRRGGDAAEEHARHGRPAYDQDRNFKRPPNEGDLL
jgi:hypothetical protein